MTRLDKFTRVAEIAEQRADNATLKLAERINGVASGEAQLGELHRFRSEYVIDAANAPALAIAALVNRHRFLGRVDEAIAFQQREVERQQRLLVQEQRHCGEARAKSRALDNTVARLSAAETRRSDRYEQSELDERSQYQRFAWSEPSGEGVDG